ncbi:FAD-dependent oxidoreductase [Nocardia pseudobrasiliensis]|uniref:2-polyprenyl-6-methoxyphenol hydroxylase-like FAD-dependent oxidoreductase n=1 Tax=Nocardia pseudobrasiliensis TaxID=45979 RepID=A0A370HPF3_9NOCA|nr:FAD-dependent oxidoreductase [Nocardia pseudobrasiliensis]RDI60419.1 2-polyprenyl-6-methoxyphenol hydroxylase-like FAD-dependent oxidoreductase [Nocardia pseudobrasiliensis]
MTETFDVVVAGAGPVGLMLACELRLAGVDVLVVERLTEPDQTIKAGGMNVAAAEAFYRRGMLPELQRRAYLRMEQFAAFAKAASTTVGKPKVMGGHFAGIFLDASLIHTDDPIYADPAPVVGAIFVHQQGIEEVLAERAEQLGVPVRRGVELTGFTDDSDCVTIWLGDTVIRAAWLVGCDGGRSTVRKLGGFEFPGVDPLITGHQAVVEMSYTEGLRPGWHTTDTGIYAVGPTPGRILAVELDGPPADREAPVTAAELQAALRKASGTQVEITAVHSATRFTDNTRQATDYRRGRVLLAGDAAHVHSPFGGQGLNLGIGDAVNLGWKLAAVVAGWAPDDLLDSYTAERHPIGEWVLDWTRAQVAIMRTDAHSRAMRRVTEQLLATRDGATLVHRKISGRELHYDLGVGHPLVGRSVPDFELSDGTRLGEHFGDGRAVLVDLTDSPALREAAAPWSDRVRTLIVKTAQPRDISALLVRPDGFVAWATRAGSTVGLTAALSRWFGAPA